MTSIIKPDSQLKERRWQENDKVSVNVQPYDSSIVLTDEGGEVGEKRKPLSIPHNCKVTELIEYAYTTLGAKNSLTSERK
jgi:hypothetical protein